MTILIDWAAIHPGNECLAEESIVIKWTMMGGLKNKTAILNYMSYTSDKNQPSLFS